MRMPRMQVYLPEPRYTEVKSRKLPVSRLLQEAIREEVRRQDLVSAAEPDAAELLRRSASLDRLISRGRGT